MDARDDGGLVLELGALGGDEAQDHLLARRHLGERLEPAGALVVELQVEGVDVLGAEQGVRHRVVSAGGEVGGMVVAAAHVRVDDQVVGGSRGDHAVVDGHEQVHVGVKLLVGGKAGELARHLGVDETAPRAVVELQVAPAGRVEVGDELGIGGNHVVGEGLDGAVVGKRVLKLLGAGEQGVELARSRDGELGHRVLVLLRLDEQEVVDEGVVADGQLALDGDVVDGRGLALEGGVAGLGLDARHAVDIPHEVEVPGQAAELAVGDDAQTGGLLLGDEVEDGLVLGGFQLVGGKLAALEGGAGLAQVVRAQEAADDVEALRCVDGAHGFSPLRFDCVRCILEERPSIVKYRLPSVVHSFFLWQLFAETVALCTECGPRWQEIAAPVAPCRANAPFEASYSSFRSSRRVKRYRNSNNLPPRPYLAARAFGNSKTLPRAPPARNTNLRHAIAKDTTQLAFVQYIERVSIMFV